MLTVIRTCAPRLDFCLQLPKSVPRGLLSEHYTLTRSTLPCLLLPTLVYIVPDPVLPCPAREFVLDSVMNSVRDSAINVDRPLLKLNPVWKAKAGFTSRRSKPQRMCVAMLMVCEASGETHSEVYGLQVA